MRADVQNVIVASSTPTSGQLMMKSFVSGAYRVEAVHGGAAALEKLNDGNYHLLVLDQWLPDLDVNDVFQTVRARFPEVTVTCHNALERTGLCLPRVRGDQTREGQHRFSTSRNGPTE